jgi:predicted histone-like DNA-binding protein
MKLISKQQPITKIGTSETNLKFVLNLVEAGTVSAKDIVEFASKHTSAPAVMVKAVLESSFQIVEHYLSLGYRVQLGELGTFYPTIKSKAVDSNTEAGMVQLEKVNVRFRPNSDIVEKLNKAPKTLQGIYRLVDADRKFYEEVGRGELGDAPVQPEGGDNPDPDSGGNTGGGGGGFAG